MPPSHSCKTIIEDQITLARFDENRVPFTGDSGFGQHIVFALSNIRIQNEADADDVYREQCAKWLATHKISREYEKIMTGHRLIASSALLSTLPTS